jgi:hypothetical protein
VSLAGWTLVACWSPCGAVASGGHAGRLTLPPSHAMGSSAGRARPAGPG